MGTKVNVTRVLTDFDGRELRDNGEPVVLRDVLITALVTPRAEEHVTGKDQLARYLQAQRIHDREAVELTSEEVVKLKECVAAIYRPMITGQVWLILEGEAGDPGVPADKGAR